MYSSIFKTMYLDFMLLLALIVSLFLNGRTFLGMITIYPKCPVLVFYNRQLKSQLEIRYFRIFWWYFELLILLLCSKIKISNSVLRIIHYIEIFTIKDVLLPCYINKQDNLLCLLYDELDQVIFNFLNSSLVGGKGMCGYFYFQMGAGCGGCNYVSYA